MEGKTVLITGTTDGIGKQTALEIAKTGSTVILHARNAERGKQHLTEMSDVFSQGIPSGKTSDISMPPPKFELVIGDFADLTSVKKMADDVKARFPILDVLLNNAGVLTTERAVTTDGFEMIYQVNYLSHFLLTMLLLDNIKAANAGRIINVSSNVHITANLDMNDLQSERRYDGYNAYGC